MWGNIHSIYYQVNNILYIFIILCASEKKNEREKREV